MPIFALMDISIHIGRFNLLCKFSNLKEQVFFKKNEKGKSCVTRQEEEKGKYI